MKLSKIESLWYNVSMLETGEITIGENVKRLRKARGLGQGALAEALGVSISSISKLENNSRRVKGEEIPKLYRVLGCTASELFGEEDPPFITERAIQLRAGNAISPESKPELARILARLGRQVKNLVELETTLGVQTPRTLQRSSDPVASRVTERRSQAEDLARLLRQILVLGEGPVHNLEHILEQHSVIWTRWKLPDELSGFCAHHKGRAVIVLNAAEPRHRQKFSLGHELCHAVLDGDRGVIFTRKIDLFSENQQYPSPIEHRANLFSGKFLMPLSSSTAFAKENGFDLHSLSGPNVMQLAYYFGISARAVLNTLRNYGIIDWEQQQRLEADTVPLPKDAVPSPDPLNKWCDEIATEVESLPRMVRLGFKAFFDNRINEGSLSELIDVERTRLVKLIRFYKANYVPGG